MVQTNVEPTTARASRRAPDEAGQPEQGLDSGSDLSDDGLHHGQAVVDVEYRPKRCVLCNLPFEGSRSEFEAHIRLVHGPEAKAIKERETVIPCVTHCRWLCSVCKRESLFRIKEPGTHAGPMQRSFDRRFALHNCFGARYPLHKRAFGTINGEPNPTIYYHEGMEFSPQPEQTDPSVQRFIKVKEVKPRASRVSKNPNPEGSSKRTKAHEQVARVSRTQR